MIMTRCDITQGNATFGTNQLFQYDDVNARLDKYCYDQNAWQEATRIMFQLEYETDSSTLMNISEEVEQKTDH